MTTIAVDDEPKALEIIQNHCAKIPFLELKKSFRDPVDAIAWLQSNPVDLVLLDINMPNLSGLKFRALIGEKPMIIFTTAYSEFALESYELGAVDYLLKPIRFERFFKALLKARDQRGVKSDSQIEPLPVLTGVERNHIYVKSGSKHFKLNSADILYLVKDGNYIIFHTTDKKVMSRLSIQQVMNILPEKDFLKVHKSYIIGIRHIDIIENHQVLIQNIRIPVAKPYRSVLLEKLKLYRK